VSHFKETRVIHACFNERGGRMSAGDIREEFVGGVKIFSHKDKKVELSKKPPT